MRTGLVVCVAVVLALAMPDGVLCLEQDAGVSTTFERADGLTARGKELLDRGLFSAARDSLELALDLDPDCAGAHARLAAVMAWTKLDASAMEFHLGRAVTIAPNDTATLECLAFVRFSEMEFEQLADITDWAEKNGIESPGFRLWRSSSELRKQNYSAGYEILQELHAEGYASSLAFSLLVQATMFMDGEEAARELLDSFCGAPDIDYYGFMDCAQARLMIGPRTGIVEEEFLQAAGAVPDDPHAVYFVGRVMVDFDEFELAESFLTENAHRIDPTLPWEYWYGMALRRNGDLDEAEAVVRRALEESPFDLRLRKELGQILGFAGDTDGATVEFRHTAAQDTSDAEAAWVLASLLSGRGTYEEAVVHARRSVRHDSLDHRLWNNLAAYEKALGNQQAFLDALTRAVEVAPHLPKLRFQLVNALTEAKRIDLAIEHIDIVIGPAPWQLGDEKGLYELLAYAAAEVGDSERGARAGRGLIERNSTKFAALLAAAEATSRSDLGDGLIEVGADRELVLELVGRAREIGTEERTGLHRISKCASAVGDDRLARGIVLEAIAMDSTYVDAYLGASFTSNALDEPQEGERYARKALELAPGSATALYDLGRSLRLQGKHEVAIEQLELAAAAGDTSIALSVEMALSCAGAGRYEDAVGLAHEAVASGAEFGPLVFLAVGRYYNGTGDATLLKATYEESRRACNEIGKEHWGGSIQEWLDDDRIEF